MWNVASALVICLPLLLCRSASSCQGRERRRATVLVVTVLTAEVCPLVLAGRLAHVHNRDGRLLCYTRRHRGLGDLPPPVCMACRLLRRVNHLQSRVDTRSHPWRNPHLWRDRLRLRHHAYQPTIARALHPDSLPRLAPEPRALRWPDQRLPQEL